MVVLKKTVSAVGGFFGLLEILKFPEPRSATCSLQSPRGKTIPFLLSCLALDPFSLKPTLVDHVCHLVGADDSVAVHVESLDDARIDFIVVELPVAIRIEQVERCDALAVDAMLT